MSAGSVTQQDAGALMRGNLIRFLRTLRGYGFAVGPADSADALRALAAGAGANPHLWRQALKTICCRNARQWSAFDEIFDAFWLRREMRTLLRQKDLPQKRRGPTLTQAGQGAGRPVGLQVEAWRRGQEEDAGPRPAEMPSDGASQQAALRQADFKDMTDPEALRAAEKVAALLAASLRARRTRRFRRAARGQIDLRRTIRRSVARGGVPIDLIRRRRREEPMRIVALLDASGSMEPYMRAFARFLRGLVQCSRLADAYLFHTHLVHVTPALRERDPQRAIDRMVLMAQGLGGGTLIGESLAAFNAQYARSALKGRACVVILSDGFDAGEPDLLAAELAQLKRRCRRLVWLNPLLGAAGYRPEARGMQAALPYVDLFASAHNLDSLAALAPQLARL